MKDKLNLVHRLGFLVLASLVAAFCPANAQDGISEQENQRLHEALQRFAVPADLAPRKLRSDAPVADAPSDSDDDGLPDDVEERLNTDPHNPDTDGDALLDGWEVYGVNGIDLHANGASPLHKDIFIEMDYMRRDSASHGLGPNNNVLQRIEAIFASAPTSNPDGRTGINIHLELGNEVPYDDDLNPSADEFAALKEMNFDAARAPVYHYMIWANGRDGDRRSGRTFGIPSSDFVVTLGVWSEGTGGTDEPKIGTFVHELGHNLGLRHGGIENQNFKPNHLSVMNYFFQMDGVQRDGGNSYDYQRFSTSNLNEHELNEGAGLGQGPELQGYFTRFWLSADEARQVIAAGAIDWDDNNRLDPAIQRDLNSDEQMLDLAATPNEWSMLVFNGGTSGQRMDIARLFDFARSQYQPLETPELTEEVNRKIREGLRNP
jgi:hypothetical protein